MSKFAACLLLPLPSFIKVIVLRHVCGWKVGREVKIGFSFLNAAKAELGDRAKIGHFNVISGMASLKVGDDAIIGFANIVLGGNEVIIGDGAVIGRFNEINSILNPLVRGVPTPNFRLGRRAVVTAWHKIDFTDRVDIGESTIIAGRLSNIWTHNRQDIGPVTLGPNCYVGSGIQMVPGSSIAAACVVGLGAIVTKRHEDCNVLIAGVPARVVRPLDDSGTRLVTYPTRPELDGFGDLG